MKIELTEREWDAIELGFIRAAYDGIAAELDGLDWRWPPDPEVGGITLASASVPLRTGWTAAEIINERYYEVYS